MATTNADIDKRLSALELDMGLVKKEQNHLRELFTANFKAVENNLGLLSSKFDQLMSKIDQQAGDPSASPAGRVILDRVDALRKESDSRLSDHEDWRAIRKAWWVAVPGGLGMLVAQGFIVGKLLGWI